MLTQGSGLFVAFSTFSKESLIEDLFSSYRQDCPRANGNLVATKWIMSQKSDDVPNLHCKRRYLFLILHFLGFLSGFTYFHDIFCRAALLEKRVVCNRYLQSPSPHSRECHHPLPDWAWPCLTLCHVSGAPEWQEGEKQNLPQPATLSPMLFGCLLLLAFHLPVAGHPLTMLGGCMQGGVAMGLGLSWGWFMMLPGGETRCKVL